MSHLQSTKSPPASAESPQDQSLRIFWAAVALIIALAAIIRFSFLTHTSLWMDESISIVTADPAKPVTELLRMAVSPGFLPPMHFLFLRAVLATWPGSVALVRAVPATFGMLTVLAMALVGQLLANWRVGLVAALWLALAPWHIFYSLEVRPYAETMCAAVLYMLAMARYHANPSWSRASIAVLAFLYGCMVNTLFLLTAVPVCGAFLLSWALRRDWKHIVLQIAAHLVLTGVVYVTYRWLGLASTLSGSLRVAPIHSASLLADWRDLINAFVYGTPYNGNIQDHPLLLLLIAAAFFAAPPTSALSLRFMAIAALFMLPFTLFLFRKLGVWVGPNPRYFAWAFPPIALGIAFAVARFADVLGYALAYLQRRFSPSQSARTLPKVLSAALLLLASHLVMTTAHINAFSTFLRDDYEKSPWNDIRKTVFNLCRSNEHVVVISTVRFDCTPYIYFRMFAHPPNLTYVHRHGGQPAVSRADLAIHLEGVAHRRKKLVYLVDHNAWSPDTRLFTKTTFLKGYPAIDMFVLNDIPYPLSDAALQIYESAFGRDFIDHLHFRTIAELSMRDLSYGGATMLCTNPHLTYPEVPFLLSTGDVGCFAECTFVINTQLPVFVEIEYFSGLPLGLNLAHNGVLLARELCTNITGWCAWDTAKDRFGPITLVPGTNTLWLGRRRGMLPNLLFIRLREQFRPSPQ